MYREFLDLYRLDPGECIFVDDTPENVEAAMALGFNGIIFKDPDDMRSAISEITAVNFSV